MAWFLFDLLLLLLATARASRFITTDSLGQWWIVAPIQKFVYAGPQKRRARFGKYVDGLGCPFCVGFWVGVVALLTLWAVGGPGDAAEWWRYAAGAFALNYVIAHVAAYLDV